MEDPVRRMPIQSSPGAKCTGPRWATIPSRGGGRFVVLPPPDLLLEVMMTGSLMDRVSSELMVCCCFDSVGEMMQVESCLILLLLVAWVIFGLNGSSKFHPAREFEGDIIVNRTRFIYIGNRIIFKYRRTNKYHWDIHSQY